MSLCGQSRVRVKLNNVHVIAADPLPPRRASGLRRFFPTKVEIRPLIRPTDATDVHGGLDTDWPCSPKTCMFRMQNEPAFTILLMVWIEADIGTI